MLCDEAATKQTWQTTSDKQAMKFCLSQWLDWENDCMSQTGQRENSSRGDEDNQNIVS